MKYFIIISLLSIIGCNAAYNQININVNTDSIIASGVIEKYGINLNAGIDDDINRPVSARTLSDAIVETGSKRLRYPGGKKSNYYAWALAPFNDPNTGQWYSWYDGMAENTLDFDEFMTLCSETGALPHINVAWNPDVAVIDENLAAEWVKYANITNDYGIEYWEIGNEMWHPDYGLTFAQVVLIAQSYTAAMKAVDPSIKVGISWKYAQSQNLIDSVPSLDFLTVSNYTSNASSYDLYRTTNNMDLLFRVNEGVSLNTVISEFAHTDWTGSAWDDINSTGKGLICFDIVGQILKNQKVEYGCFWNTRWYSQSGWKFDALDTVNNLLPVIQPFSLWGKFIENDLVEISNGTPTIVAYAAYDSISGDLNVFLLNKDLTSQEVNISYSSSNLYTFADIWQYSGVNEWDTIPSLGQVDTTSIVSDSLINYILPSTSITVFSYKNDVSSNKFDLQKFKIYPNPINQGNTLTIIGYEINKVEIYSVLGNKIAQYDYHNKNKVVIDAVLFSSGAYIIKINGSHSLKFLKY